MNQSTGWRGRLRKLAFWGVTISFVAALGYSAYGSDAKPKSAHALAPGNIAGLTRTDFKDLSTHFNKEVWPLMVKDCLPCHGQKNSSQFLLLKEPRAAFLKMIGEGHFDPDNHASVIERVNTTDKQIKMPPTGMTPLTPAEMAVFTHFAEDVQRRRALGAKGVKPDEMFPAQLQTPFSGKAASTSAPNTFLSYRQLRGKVQAIFQDDWTRADGQSGAERNLFVENAQLFGGADFVKRFDETTKASPTFLTGVDLLGRDIASRAYLARTGPFAGFAENLPDPAQMKSPNPAYQAAINHLYNRMLFRNATPGEQKEAFAFLQSVFKEKSALTQTAPQDLRFALTVRDDRGLRTAQGVTIRVSPDRHALYSELVDQSRDAADGKIKTATRTLAQPFQFVPGDDDQKIVVTNGGTHGNVSIASVTLRGPLPLKTETVLTVKDPAVRPEGAWNIKGDDNITTYEDNNENKGSSQITFPVAVKTAGSYEVAVTWRRFAPDPPKEAPKEVKKDIAAKAADAKTAVVAAAAVKKPRRRRAPLHGAENVPVEVVSRDTKGHLAIPPAPPVPPRGEAEFYIDQTVDTIPFWDLRTAFQFGGANDGIEIRNDGTRRRVVADAVRLMPPVASALSDSKDDLLLRGADAVGKTTWVPYKGASFGAFNTVGPDIFQDMDDTGKKENLSLLYKPSAATKAGFQPNNFYRVGVIFPGQVENESRVPVVVHAQASAPIVQIVHPEHAHIGSEIVLDASSTYNLQHSPLKFQWTQIGGPRVALANPTASRLNFVAPGMTPRQAAWEGLCRALLLHPDFLFTRPRSLASVTDPTTRHRLQLVKIAQDLLSRTPTAAEIARVDSGTPLSVMVDTYLKSPEFRDFYFHRVRLYVESHGTPEQDEPARLWSYIAQNDLPFKQILTADYTVDTNFKKQPRPSFHGKSGVLTMKGFIEGKPGLPHYNYPAQVAEKFLGYVFEVPAEVIATRNGLTASATTDPKSICYSCHKVLTPLAYQRSYWNDLGGFNRFDETAMHVDDSDHQMVASYPFKGNGIEAFALQAQNKERFIRTILQTHFVWYFGRELRYETDERGLYHRLWDVAQTNHYAIRPLIKAIVLSPEYLNGSSQTPLDKTAPKRNLRMAKLAAFHRSAMR